MAYVIRKILCPIDFDDSVETALETVEIVAQQHNAAVYLLNVCPPLLAPRPELAEGELNQPPEELARAKLEQFAGHFLKRIHCQVLAYSGIATETILKIARDLPADLIIMATHARRGLKRLALGSVVEEVLRAAPCPVLTARLEKP